MSKNPVFFSSFSNLILIIKEEKFPKKPCFLLVLVYSSRIRGQTWVCLNRKSNMVPDLQKNTPKFGIFFFVIFFFGSTEFRDSILTMINSNRNGWSLRKNFFCRSQWAITFSKLRISHMVDIKFWNRKSKCAMLCITLRPSFLCFPAY